jgi:hypothetical protein
MTCVQCHKTVSKPKRGPTPRYCGTVCRSAAYRDRKRREPLAERLCKECVEVFQPVRHDQIFCQRSCKASWWGRVETARRQQGNWFRCSDPYYMRGRHQRELVKKLWPEMLEEPCRQ